MFIAHGPLSSIIVEKIRKRYFPHISHKFIPALILLSLISGILPDFDFFILAMQSKPAFIHHSLITHTPIFWISISAIVYIFLRIVESYTKPKVSKFLKGGGTNLISISLLLGTLSHVITDTITGHIKLLYPLTDQSFTLFANIVPINPSSTYFFHPFMIFEIAIVISFICMILKLATDIKNQQIKVIAFISTIILTPLLISSIYVYNNTYIPKLPRTTHSNTPTYDRDDDYIHDYFDVDINNNGVDNLDDAERSKIAEIAYKIAKSSKLAVPSDDGYGFQKKIGYLSPFGIISTAYFESGYTIEPVIKNHFRLGNSSAEVEYSLDTYFKILEGRDMLKEVSLGETINQFEIGKTLFILKDWRVINAGITLKENQLTIILDNDKRTKPHKVETVINYYLNNTNNLRLIIEK